MSCGLHDEVSTSGALGVFLVCLFSWFVGLICGRLSERFPK
jgi:hypothetical protein